MEVRGQIAAGEIVATCADDLVPLARTLLAALGARDRAGPALAAGSRVQFGWSTLTLRRDGGMLRLCEPDFDADPRAGVSARVDHSLAVIRDQAELLRRTGLRGEDARWDAQLIVVPKDVLRASHLFLRREAPSAEEDSGWLIGNADDPPGEGTAARADAVQVYRLLSLRPFLLRLLALPPGSFARVSGDRIEEITDPAGRNRLPLSGAVNDPVPP